ncbi:hypothetical protein LDENG_00235210 [Lucifuga dentata]|nr:hypothetical protein LDENG_00235210 [Lucifuga dentata]
MLPSLVSRINLVGSKSFKTLLHVLCSIYTVPYPLTTSPLSSSSFTGSLSNTGLTTKSFCSPSKPSTFLPPHISLNVCSCTVLLILYDPPLLDSSQFLPLDSEP